MKKPNLTHSMKFLEYIKSECQREMIEGNIKRLKNTLKYINDAFEEAEISKNITNVSLTFNVP
jgi:hypothetical protein